MGTRKNIPPNQPEKPPAGEQQEEDEALDQTIADSFPASDPPSSIPDPHDSEDAA